MFMLTLKENATDISKVLTMLSATLLTFPVFSVLKKSGAKMQLVGKKQEHVRWIEIETRVVAKYIKSEAQTRAIDVSKERKTKNKVKVNV